MNDYLIRVISNQSNVRGLACITTELAKKASAIQKTTPTPSAALSRALTGVSLMGALLKKNQRVVLRFDGNGPMQKMAVESNGSGAVRGYVGVPNAELPLKNGKVDVAGAIGRAGLLTVTRDIGLKEPYTSTVHLVSGEIGEDLAYYFTASEQVPSAVGVGSFVEPDGRITAAGGFLIQALPDADPTAIDGIVERIRYMRSITEQIRDGATPEQFIDELFDSVQYQILQKIPLAYSCSCSRQRVEKGLLSIGKDQLRSLKQEKDPVSAECEFCHQRYEFSDEDIQELIDTLSRK
ncbi:MAG: Hsp33 family molecular chaperone HslO [Chitinivibrionales bacterium]